MSTTVTVDNKDREELIAKGVLRGSTGWVVTSLSGFVTPYPIRVFQPDEWKSEFEGEWINLTSGKPGMISARKVPVTVAQKLSYLNPFGTDREQIAIVRQCERDKLDSAKQFK